MTPVPVEHMLLEFVVSGMVDGQTVPMYGA
jgi:hypothetical protein